MHPSVYNKDTTLDVPELVHDGRGETDPVEIKKKTAAMRDLRFENYSIVKAEAACAVPAAVVVVVFDNVFGQVKRFFDFCKHFRFVDASVDVYDGPVVCAIPYDTSAGIEDIIPGLEVVIPQFVMAVWVIDLVRLLSPHRQLA